MANKEHLARLKQGIEAWNEWRKAHPEITPDLTEANLSRESRFKVFSSSPHVTVGPTLLGHFSIVRGSPMPTSFRQNSLRQISPLLFSMEQVSSRRTSPGRTSPGRTSSRHTSPGRISPGRISPGQTSLWHISPKRTLARQTLWRLG
jgi:hypothetical protein